MRAKEEALLIALSGGSQKEREAIAARLVESGKVGLQVYSQPDPNSRYPARRHSILSTALQGSPLRSQAKGVVVAHCLTEREAGLVRELGGAVWHLYSRPSAEVVIRNGDLIVINDEESVGHLLCPLDALSEQMMAKAG